MRRTEPGPRSTHTLQAAMICRDSPGTSSVSVSLSIPRLHFGGRSEFIFSSFSLLTESLLLLENQVPMLKRVRAMCRVFWSVEVCLLTILEAELLSTGREESWVRNERRPGFEEERHESLRRCYSPSWSSAAVQDSVTLEHDHLTAGWKLKIE